MPSAAKGRRLSGLVAFGAAFAFSNLAELPVLRPPYVWRLAECAAGPPTVQTGSPHVVMLRVAARKRSDKTAARRQDVGATKSESKRSPARCKVLGTVNFHWRRLQDLCLVAA